MGFEDEETGAIEEEDDESGIVCPKCNSILVDLIEAKSYLKGIHEAYRCVHCGKPFSFIRRSQ